MNVDEVMPVRFEGDPIVLPGIFSVEIVFVLSVSSKEGRPLFFGQLRHGTVEIVQ